MANAYKLGLSGVLKAVLERIQAFHTLITDPPFYSGEKICDDGRPGAEDYFARDESVRKTYMEQLLLKDKESVLEQRKIHFIAALEQDHNVRYNCSRRHAIKTAGNNAQRMAKDLPNSYKYEEWPDA